jgi:DNA invertase Pin-like site-specific DNA recombinase
MKTSVIYARVSSIGDRQSTERQVNDLQRYAAANNIEVAKVFEEHISGAKKNEERPVLIECLEFSIKNGIDVLLLSELSRLGRNVDEVLANVRLCKESHLNIFFQKEGISIFLPDGKENPFLTIMVAVLGTCAQLERENISYRLNSGLRRYIEGGGKLGRKKGYIKPLDKKMSERPDVVKELRRGTSIRRTAKLCDASVSTVQRLREEMISENLL